MHEVSLIEGLVDLIAAEARKQAFSQVRVIRLRLGALGHAEPEALQFCFDAVTNGTIADGARLEIEMVLGRGWCFGCESTALLDERFAACPRCGKAPLQILTGDELQLAELEVD